MSEKIPPKDDASNAWRQVAAQIRDAELGPEHYQRAIYLLNMLRKAVGDLNHPAWQRVIDPAFNGGWSRNSQDLRIAHAFEILEGELSWAKYGISRDDVIYGVKDTITWELPQTDRAFEGLEERSLKPLIRPCLYESRGAVGLLAHLTLACGALGAARIEKPTKADIKAEANRLRQARLRARKPSSHT